MTQITKHTAGPSPWRVVVEHDNSSIDGNYIAGVQDAKGDWVVRYDDDYGTGPELGPNTRLIAKAWLLPELLQAISIAADILNGIEDSEQVNIAQDYLSEALAKAEYASATGAA